MSSDTRLTLGRSGARSAQLRRAFEQLPDDGPERKAIGAGEIDALVDYRTGNVIMFPAARRALLDAANHRSAAVSSVAIEDPRANNLLAALPRVEYGWLRRSIELVTLAPGEVLHEPGALVRYVYFPIDCAVCLLTKAEGQRTLATGLVGCEGMVGISRALDVETASVRALVQAAGMAMRLPAARLLKELRRCPTLRQELLRYAHAELALARQIAACIASHCLEQRLACWLLMSNDRSKAKEMPLTQDYLAAIMNVRRESVTLASIDLRSRHLISSSRGKIRILDREGLESASCACYGNMPRPARQTRRLRLGDTPRPLAAMRATTTERR